MSTKLQAIKATLSSGMVVILRQFRISDTEIAAQEVSSRANGDANLLQLLMQKALVKNCLIEINGVAVSAAQREDLDSLFTISEYGQVMKVIQKVSGGDDLGKEPTIEHITSGDR